MKPIPCYECHAFNKVLKCAAQKDCAYEQQLKEKKEKENNENK